MSMRIENQLSAYSHATRHGSVKVGVEKLRAES